MTPTERVLWLDVVKRNPQKPGESFRDYIQRLELMFKAQRLTLATIGNVDS